MDNHSAPCLAIVMPCYNEQEVLPRTLELLLNYLELLQQKNIISPESFIYCVDDGSDDNTWPLILSWHQKSFRVKGLKLTNNVGQQYALLAGLMQVMNKVSCAVTIDADLQDDYTVIETMLQSFAAGNDIVSGIRSSRVKDNIFKQLTAAIFYKIMKKSGTDLIEQHAEFRLLSSRCIESLSHFKERNLFFLRGILPIMGYASATVYYERSQRLGGKTKYTFRKLVALAWDCVTSFSRLPISVILLLGFALFLFSLGLAGWTFAQQTSGQMTPVWVSWMIPLGFMGGIQLISIGVIGEYIAKVYLEVKNRPRFIKDIELV